VVCGYGVDMQYGSAALVLVVGAVDGGREGICLAKPAAGQKIGRAVLAKRGLCVSPESSSKPSSGYEPFGLSLAYQANIK
jgi:hypothetical protein